LERSTRYGYYYSRLGDFNGVYEQLQRKQPNIIFVHGGQFVALKDVIQYVKNHKNVTLYIDQHGDYYNGPVKTVKQRIVAKCIYGHWIRKAYKYTKKYWGVTPWRCQYLHDIYGIPTDKIDLLVMGGDDEKIDFAHQEQRRQEIRTQLSIGADDFVVITGGKIDKAKNIHLLMEAIAHLNQENIRLIVFGQPTDDMAPILEALSASERIRMLGWLPSDAVYDYFLASDLAVFPGTHSVLWEQACACGIPGVFKDWAGMHHVDVGGNCRFLSKDSTEEIQTMLGEIIEQPAVYARMKEVAVINGIREFSYEAIAKKAIGTDEVVSR
jgi:glycosyltransferase involved in cell wall biosynthesis